MKKTKALMSINIITKTIAGMARVIRKPTTGIHFVYRFAAGFREHKSHKPIKINTLIFNQSFQIKKNGLKVCFSRMGANNKPSKGFFKTCYCRAWISGKRENCLHMVYQAQTINPIIFADSFILHPVK